ncbi:MAG: DUF1015 domain-containing protein [Nitrospiraceae bacterium]|nr:MAG: DUF1015 domain-containing protein [Nitrospiraceae bacterium]
MAVIPFNGILYNPQKVDASLTMAPPYDIVSPDLKEDLYRKSPHNIIRIDFGKDKDGDNEEENRYTRAASYFNEWLHQGILTRDDAQCFYSYEIQYEINGAAKITRGFLGAVKIEELGKGKVHPHEMTYSKPKSDRLNILRYCRANTSPIFSLYSSKEKAASSILENISDQPPYIEFVYDDGFTHRLWKISDRSKIDVIVREMSHRDVFIADGHHRYETALAFKKEMEVKGMRRNGKEPFNYVLMFLANMEDEGLTLLPTHRIIEVDSEIRIRDILKQHFELKKISTGNMSGKQAIAAMLESMSSKAHSFGMYLTNTGNYYALSFNGASIDVDLPDCLKKLDVSVLHKFIFENLLNVDHYEYEMDPAVAVERAMKGSFEAVFFLNPTLISELKEVALEGHRMPPKSTYFYPKLLTGMAIYKF